MSNEKEIRDARFPREESRIQATLAFLVGRAVTRAPYTRRLQPASFTADPYRSEMFVESIDRSIDRRSTMELERNEASNCNCNLDECSGMSIRDMFVNHIREYYKKCVI